MNLPQQLASLIDGDVISDPQHLTPFSHDTSIFSITPKAVVQPRHTEDIKKLVSFVASHPDQKLSLTVRSGGTCMSGGAINTSIIVDLNKYLQGPPAIDSTHHTASVLPGTFYRDFEKATLKHQLIMPSYPASREIATVGGMVANNAGGEKTLSFGKTEDYVQELQVVLRDGNEYTVGPLTPDELHAKMEQQDFEGDLYRQVYELVDNNYDLIQSAKPAVSKDSSGYHLWNVWDKKCFDLTHLFTGSQGTLGIITNIKFRLIKPKSHSTMLVIFLRDLEPLAQIIQTTLKYHPESFESYDDHTLGLALKLLPKMIKRLGSRNLFSLSLQFLPEVQLILTGGLPKLVLLAEFTGDSKEEIMSRAEAAEAALKPLHLKTRITRTTAEAQKYWVIRRESFALLRGNIKDKHTAPFIDDLIVAPEHLPKFLPRLTALLDQYDMIYTIAGHIGDGNFHIIPLMDFHDPKQRAIIADLAPKVYALVFEYGGSMSGEHNDGLIRGPYLKQMYGEDVFKLFEQIKHIFDPDSIFNPNKKTQATLDFAAQHMITE